jgi:hypothetical protein
MEHPLGDRAGRASDDSVAYVPSACGGVVSGGNPEASAPRALP